MPFKEEMSWDAGKRRWHRMHRGVMYRVPASKLGTVPSRDATRKAANEWWDKKLAEINGPPPPDPIQQLYEEVAQAGAASPAVQGFMHAMEPLLPRAAKSSDRSIRANGENFLAVVRTDMKPLSFRELKLYVHSLNDMKPLLSGDLDVNVIDETLVDKLYLSLRNSSLSSGAKKKRWGFFRRFVTYLWQRRLLDMPRNLSSLAFEVHAKKIKTYTPKEVREILKALKPRLRLYAMLGLNAGMTSADIGQLRKDQVDLDNGRLTRRRVKTGDNENVPTVEYKLWPQTLELLNQHRSAHPDLFLTSSDGTPLWSSDYDGDRVPTKDLIYQQFKRAKAPITLKTFRSIAATVLESHESYGRYKSHFLGHSPKSVADRHYAAPSQDLFDQIMLWLHDKLFTG